MASRSIGRAFSGAPQCPLSVDFGYHHGPNPVLARLVFPGEITVPVAFPFWMYIDNAFWAGYTVSATYDSTAKNTTIEAVDWRDRLHDPHIFAAFNMQESDGRTYHILPPHWETQQRTYISRELDQQDFFAFQNLPADAVIQATVGKLSLYSVFTLFNWIGRTWNFQVFVDPFLAKIMQNTFPTNLDWNGGVKVIDAVQQLCDKVNSQFTAINMNQMYVTLRGFSQNPFTNSVLNGFNTCTLGSSRSSLGFQLHDRGRRIVLQGDRNRYEASYLCHPNWNPIWTWDLAYGGMALGALLNSLGLTLKSKIKDMPAAFHDRETWNKSPDLLGKGQRAIKRTRMDMTIEEYIDTIVYRAYVVDFNAQATAFESTRDTPTHVGTWRVQKREDLSPVSGTGGDLAAYPTNGLWNQPSLNSLWPIASKLVTESNAQAIIYAVSREVIEGSEFPFYHQLTYIPKSGVQLDIEEVINPTSGRTEYRARIYFDEPQTFMHTFAPDPFDPNAYAPDRPIVLLALEADIYQYRQGEQVNNFRSREMRVNVPNLSRGFIHDFSSGNYKEVSILSRNFAHNVNGVATPAIAPVRADDIAKSIATQLLFREAIHRSGRISFDARAGILPDGLIDSTRVSWQDSGLREEVNLSKPMEMTRDVVFPQLARVSFRFMDETELNRKRLEWAYRAAMDEMRRMAAFHEPDPGDPVVIGGIMHPVMALKTAGRHGQTVMAVRRTNFPAAGVDFIRAGDVIFG